MELSDFLGMLGGLALFLYGMQMMSSGLEAAAGAKMRMILEKLTANRFMGVLVGAGITAVIQSSSATTVMVVGFVNSGMMTLNQAVWIIMGANVGTTITGQLIGLGVGELAPIFAFVGVTLIVFVKKPQLHHIGQILAGLGVLFIGMDMMSSAMSPLRDSQAFIDILSSFSNPILGILAGAGFTAAIQSSSASVGILQALAQSGAITFGSAVYVLFGQNIGTCITAVLASIGTSRNAKRATCIHLMFNIIGTVIFTFLCINLPVADAVVWFTETYTSGGVDLQIANMHTLFNIATTLLLMPLGYYMVKLSIKFLPELPDEDCGEGMRVKFLTPVHVSNKEGGLGASAIYISQLEQELNRMLLMARDNVDESFTAVLHADMSRIEGVIEKEDYIDFLNKEISRHISHLIAYETNEQSAAVVSSYFTITGNIERIGDHSMNICGYTKHLNKHGIKFSETAKNELEEMRRVCLVSMDELLAEKTGGIAWLSKVAALEQRTDDMTKQYRKAHIQRMRAGECTDEACIIYSELLTDFERLGDHALNIAQELTRIDKHQ